MKDPEQCRSALERANEVRTRASRAKKAMRAGERTIAEVLASGDCDSVMLSQLVLCQPGLGNTKATKLIGHLQLSPYKRVGTLTTRQRLQLAQAVAERAPGRRKPRPRPQSLPDSIVPVAEVEKAAA